MFDPIMPQQSPIPQGMSSPITGPAQPINIPAGANGIPQPPAPVATPPAEEHVSAWDSVFTRIAEDKNIQQALLTAGLSMFEDRQPGESSIGKIAKGALKGVDAYNGLEDRDLDREGKKAQTASTVAGTEGTVLANETSAATQESEIRRAESQANIAESQDIVAEIGASGAQAASDTAQSTAELTEDKMTAQINLLNAQTKSEAAGKGGAKPGATQQLARAIAASRVALNPSLNADEEFLKAEEGLRNGKQPTYGSVLSELLIAGRVNSYPNAEKREVATVAAQAVARQYMEAVEAERNTPPSTTVEDPGKEATIAAMMARHKISRAVATAAYNKKAGGQ